MKSILHAGNVIIVGFAMMILFMCYLVFQCTQNPAVMVSKNYYEQELAYQNVIDSKNNTALFSSQFDLKKDNNNIVCTIPDTINRYLTKANIEFYNKADDKKDITIPLTLSTHHTYLINANQLQHGNYKVKLFMQTPKEKYYKEFEIEL